MREDRAAVDKAIAAGYTVDIKHEHEFYQFRRYNVHVWYCRKGWARAILDPETNVFTNHEYFDKLTDALGID